MDAQHEAKNKNTTINKKPNVVLEEDEKAKTEKELSLKNTDPSVNVENDNGDQQIGTDNSSHNHALIERSPEKKC